MKIKNEFTTTDLIIIGVVIVAGALLAVGLGLDLVAIGAHGISFNF